jgi:hypothetical protein
MYSPRGLCEKLLVLPRGKWRVGAVRQTGVRGWASSREAKGRIARATDILGKSGKFVWEREAKKRKEAEEGRVMGAGRKASAAGSPAELIRTEVTG